MKNADLADNSVTSPKVANGSLLEEDFAGGLPQGPRGKQGPPGSDGADGAPGAPVAPGADAASSLIGRVDMGDLSSIPDPSFAGPSGATENSDSDTVNTAVESDVVQLSPNSTNIARDLRVKALAFGTWTITLRDDGADTAVTCTVTASSTSEQVCNSGAVTATIGPGSDLSLKIDSPDCCSRALDNLRFGWRATTP